MENAEFSSDSFDGFVSGVLDGSISKFLMSEEIPGFPTIKFYPAGENAETIDYQGGRDLESLVKFVESDGTEQPEGQEEELDDEDDEEYDEDDEDFDDFEDEDFDEDEDEDIEEPEGHD